MGFTVSADIRNIVPWQQNADAAMRRAAQMAGRDAQRAMRTEGSRAIRERKRVKVADVSKLVVVFPSSKERLIWGVIASSKPMPVAAIGNARQTQRGVTAEINAGSRKLIKSAFFAEMQSGHQGVFQRRGPKRMMTKGRYAGKMRQPIAEAFTTRISEGFKDAIPRVMSKGSEVFRTTFTRVLPLEFAKRSAQRG